MCIQFVRSGEIRNSYPKTEDKVNKDKKIFLIIIMTSKIMEKKY